MRWLLLAWIPVWLWLALILAGCATSRPCEVVEKDSGLSLNIGMACMCKGQPIESMTCRVAR
jgi:hypothetical protein